jgi:hypothetical protein
MRGVKSDSASSSAAKERPCFTSRARRISPRRALELRRLPPEPRRCPRRALRDLARERGDIKPLEAPLETCCRLRAGAHRIVLSYATRGTIQCVFAERSNIVYELLLQVLA